MGYNSSGLYLQVTGATSATSGVVIQSSVWNNIHIDMGLALSQGMQELRAQPANRNIMWMNGGFEVWQRGADSSSSFPVAASTTFYTADRWYLLTGVNQASVVSFQAGLTNQSRSSCRVQRNNGQTGAGSTGFAYPLDTDEIVRMRGKLVTLSMVISAGANWSPASGAISIFLLTGTGATPAKRGATPYTGEVQPIVLGTNLTPGGAAITISVNSSVVVPINATQAEMIFFWTPTGTAGANDWFQIDDVQLEVNIAPNFTWIPTAYDRLSFPQMIEGCKRHYQKTSNYPVFAQQAGGRLGALQAVSGAASRIGVWWEYPVEVRATGTVTTFNPDNANANWQDISSATALTATIDTSTQGTKGVFLVSSTASGIDNFCVIQALIDAGI